MMMEVKRDEYWVAKIQMFPGDRLMNRIVWIYRVEKSGDIGFMLIGDEDVYWRSQVEWFEPIRRLMISEDDVR
jgi:hypothetical protein